MMYPIMETYCGLHSMAPLFAQSHNSIAKRAGSTFRGVEACKYMIIYLGRAGRNGSYLCQWLQLT